LGFSGLLLGACSKTTLIDPHFDGPIAVTVLQPETGGPFLRSVGFVSNSRGGRITPLDLKAGRILSDDPAASFLRGSYLATGDARILGDIAVHAPDTETITLFVGDFLTSRLLEVPYVVGFDRAPIEVVPQAGEPLFEDLDSSGDETYVAGLHLRAGYTTTETWTFVYREGGWDIEGSRSGKQALQAFFGAQYRTAYRELEFELTGSATEGDRITLTTDTGIVEYDVGGAVQGMALSPDQAVLALSTFDRDTARTGLVLFDTASRLVLGSIPLPEGSQPYRLDWDDAGERLFVADVSLPQFYEIEVDRAVPADSLLQVHATALPLTDLAWIAIEGTERLVLAPVGQNRLELLDLPTGLLVDPNPYTDEILGVDLGSPVTGLSAVPLLVPTNEVTEWGAHYERPLVAVSLLNGSMVLLDAGTGCLAPDRYGPRSYEASSDNYAFTDLGAASDPLMLEDEATGRHLTVNACPGLAVDESLSIVYLESEQAWRVEGSRSGPRDELAYENQRYISEDGLIGFTVMSGLLPSTDGDRYTATLKSGVLRVVGDLDGDETVDRPFMLPGRPQAFWYEAGATGGGWDAPVTRIYGLWPIVNSDLVVRARLDKGNPEVIWE
jgi:hypothetical protein